MRSFILVSCTLSLLGCAPTARERLGDVARYAPAYAGYVAGPGEDPVILRDPVSFEKIRCREDLERFAPTLVEALEREVRDRHVRVAADAGLAPFTAVGYAGTLLGIGLLFPALAIITAGGHTERGLYAAARDAFLASRHHEARDLFLAAILGRQGVEALPRPWKELSLYYLGLSDEALHRDGEAAAALRRFVTTAEVKDEARYGDAERRLGRLDPGAIPACQSRADLTLPWRRSP